MAQGSAQDPNLPLNHFLAARPLLFYLPLGQRPNCDVPARPIFTKQTFIEVLCWTLFLSLSLSLSLSLLALLLVYDGGGLFLELTRFGV